MDPEQMPAGDDAHLGETFDRQAEYFVENRLRPHWSQAGAIVFITFRTHDSIPRDVLRRWDQEKLIWLSSRGFQGRWEEVVPTLEESVRREFLQRFDRCREEFLDTCHGACHFRRPELAQIVADTLLHFDGERYQMGDFVIMPNHVHLLAAFPTETSMKEQCVSWLRYSATQVNRKLGQTGKLWQQEPFDHLVRNHEQYEYLRKYIADNPVKARLAEGQFLYRRLPNASDCE